MIVFSMHKESKIEAKNYRIVLAFSSSHHTSTAGELNASKIYLISQKLCFALYFRYQMNRPYLSTATFPVPATRDTDECMLYRKHTFFAQIIDTPKYKFS